MDLRNQYKRLFEGRMSSNDAQLLTEAALRGVKIGSQTWAAEDLKVTNFRNGEPIPFIKDKKEWQQYGASGEAAYCLAPNGHCLYNWYAVNDPRGLAPAGWRVASDQDWQKLVNFVSDEETAGTALKDDQKWDGTNEYGFSAVPSNYRSKEGDFIGVRSGDNNGHWWTSTPAGSKGTIAIAYFMATVDTRPGREMYNYSNASRSRYTARRGCAVRCIK